MTTFDVVIILGGTCGLFMVIGGMLLLYKGVISLNKVSKQKAVSLEFKNLIKITSHYPGLAIFIIGLAFIISAAMFSKPKEVSPLKIEGRVDVSDSSSITIFISADQWRGEPLTDGRIEGLIYPNLDRLKVEIVAAGYDPPKFTTVIKSEDIKSGTASLGEIALGKRKVDKPEVNPGNIKPVSEKLPPLTESGKF